MTFKVMAQPCATCIYRKDSPLDLRKLEDDVRDPFMGFKGHRICHHSKDVCCRGFWNAHKDEFAAGQIAQRLNLVEFVEEQPNPERNVMSNKTQLKHAKRRARQTGQALPSAAEIERMFGQNLVEQRRAEAERRARERAEMNAAIAKANAHRRATSVRKTEAPTSSAVRSSPVDQRRFELVDGAAGVIQEGSLRAAIVEALRAKRGSMSYEELSAVLGRDARPVVQKLEAKGWVKPAA